MAKEITEEKEITDFRGHHFVFATGFLKDPERGVRGDETLRWLFSDPNRKIIVTDQCDVVCRGEKDSECPQHDKGRKICLQDERIRKDFPPSVSGYLIDNDRRIAEEYGLPVGTLTTVGELVRRLQDGPRAFHHKPERGPKIVSRLRSWFGNHRECFWGR